MVLPTHHLNQSKDKFKIQISNVLNGPTAHCEPKERGNLFFNVL